MGLFDQLLGGVVGQLGNESQRGSLMDLATSVIQSQPGGLGGLLQKFQASGLGDHANSWVGTGENKPVSRRSALGRPRVRQHRRDGAEARNQSAGGERRARGAPARDHRPAHAEGAGRARRGPRVDAELAEGEAAGLAARRLRCARRGWLRAHVDLGAALFEAHLVHQLVDEVDPPAAGREEVDARASGSGSRPDRSPDRDRARRSACRVRDHRRRSTGSAWTGRGRCRARSRWRAPRAGRARSRTRGRRRSPSRSRSP